MKIKAVAKLLKEYVILEKMKDEFDIEPARREDVEVFIRKHYLKSFPTNIKRVYGIYRKEMQGRKMVGMIIYGLPFPTATRFLEPEVQLQETAELKRLYIDDIGVKNLESFAIGQSISRLKQDEPQIKVVITFADDKQGHVGGIYQATNAIYLGKTGGKHKYIYILRGNINAIKNKIYSLVQQYPKKEMTENGFYNDIGHNAQSFLWAWFNDEERFIVKPSIGMSHAEWKECKRSDYQGRYDPKTKMVSVVNMGSYREKIYSTTIEGMPENLKRRLKFEFGDDIKMQAFYEESKQLNESTLQMPTRIPPKMYHGTIESRGNRIWKYGLEPVRTRNYDWAEKGVYLTTNPSVAKAFGNAGNYAPENATGRISSFMPRSRESVVIVTVNTKGLDPKKFRVDPNAQSSLIYFGTIPAKNIEDWEVVDDKDKNLYD